MTSRCKASSAGGGAGDRPGQELALRASGDRHVPVATPSSSTRLRCARAALYDLAGKCIAYVAMVVAADDLPPIVMFEGEPFLRQPRSQNYLQQRAYRADGLEVRP